MRDLNPIVPVKEFLKRDILTSVARTIVSIGKNLSKF